MVQISVCLSIREALVLYFGKRVGGRGGVIPSLYVRCVFLARVWSGSFTARILPRSSFKKNVLVKLFLMHFHAVDICLDRCLAPQENIQLCIDVTVAAV